MKKTMWGKGVVNVKKTRQRRRAVQKNTGKVRARYTRKGDTQKNNQI